MSFFSFNRVERDTGKIINKVDRTLKDNKKDYVPNENIGKRKTTEEFEDDYTTKLRAENQQWSGGRKADSFINEAGQEMPISQLNGQTEQLLREARESLNQEMDNNLKLKAKGTEGEDLETELSKRRLKKNDLYSGDKRQAVDNLKTNSPAKRREDIREERKSRENDKWAALTENAEDNWPDLPDLSKN